MSKVEQPSPFSRWLMIGLLLGFSSAVAADDAADWLRRMARAVQSLDYDGTFVYLRDDRLESMRIVHVSEGGQERERLLSLNGDTREVIRNQDMVTCIRPGGQAVIENHSGKRRLFPTLGAAGLEALERHYAFTTVSEDRVAGRPVVVVGIIPRDAYRYGYRLYLDRDSALPLKTDLMDESGRPLEQIMFTSLRVGAEVDQLPAISSIERQGRASTDDSTPESRAEAVPTPRWRAAGLPAGFVLNAQNRRTGPPASAPIEHLVFSDGLASVSLYIERLAPGGDTGLVGASRMGAVSAFGAQVAGHQVTAVGEVPPATVRLAAESAEYLDTPAP